ncbi:uncharacterized protein E0L32_011836 [Thyridium curvatum]|uniref:NADP-dependent oxidoreductase domain-containing protein n=1 Tax=Thyridium curvatum TaxID=1093900 RepID=A0A507B726_9PEZI|nr:uncharacterized protein E0L32_011836 [Thyridium curvatum]TPX18112.1 hypothetical protein E0L32_011836 [Thyridium curvatum]
MVTSPRTDPRTSLIEGLPDLILEHIPAAGLRKVLREVLNADTNFTYAFEGHTRKYITKNAPPHTEPLFGAGLEEGEAKNVRDRIRTMFGAGMYFETLAIFQEIAEQATYIHLSGDATDIINFLILVDGDIIEAMVGIQRIQQDKTGLRAWAADEAEAMESLVNALAAHGAAWEKAGREPPFVRGLASTQKTIDPTRPVEIKGLTTVSTNTSGSSAVTKVETFKIGDREVPRMFSGLWQLSSTAFGTASALKIAAQFSHHVEAGLTAFDMADHYGDAEVVYGQFCKSLSDPGQTFASTKYCVFTSLDVTREAVRQNITQRVGRMEKDKIDLLQVHWQIWEEPGYIELLKYCQEDERVSNLGLCNFDTAHLQEAWDAGIRFVTNQSQFSLVDSRPTVKLGKFCEEHGVKVLTFGTLCGGFLSERWLGKPDPDFYGQDMNPSTRLIWGGWDLFQELLQCLKAISVKRSVSVTNVANRWVLDHPFVGGTIIGSRMGVSERVKDNLAVFGWRLDDEDQANIEAVLSKSRRKEMFEEIGDCGYEYRSDWQQLLG